MFSEGLVPPMLMIVCFEALSKNLASEILPQTFTFSPTCFRASSGAISTGTGGVVKESIRSINKLFISIWVKSVQLRVDRRQKVGMFKNYFSTLPRQKIY